MRWMNARRFMCVLAVTATACHAGVPTSPSGITVSGPHGDYRQVILRTVPDPVPCDGVVRSFFWTPAQPIVIRSITLWIGTTWVFPDVPENRPLIDVRSTVMLPDGFVLAYLGLDHYAAFSGPSQIEKRFDPPVPVSGPIRLEHACTNYGKTSPMSATNAIIDWAAR